MIKTHGLTHIQLLVRDIKRSEQFYRQVFGAEELFREGPNWVFLNVPGTSDMITLTQPHASNESPGTMGGIAHFGFRLQDPNDIDRAIEEAIAAGGTLLRRGEHEAGQPFAHIADPDGYDIEIWYS